MKSNQKKRFISYLIGQIHRPVLVQLLRKQWHAIILVSVVILHLILSILAFDLWQCQIKIVTGIRCPGCGLSSAISHMVRGEFLEMLYEHAFAPFFTIGIIFIFMISLLPADKYRKAVARIFDFEKRTGFINYFLIGFVVYWIIRLILGV